MSTVAFRLFLTHLAHVVMLLETWDVRLSLFRLTPELLNELMVKEMEKEVCQWTVVKHYSDNDT